MIETAEDWNERLGQCGCCSVHECTIPDAEEDIAVHRTHHTPVAFDSGTYYLRRLLHYLPGGTLDEFYDQNFETSLEVNPLNSITTPPIAVIPTSIDYFNPHTPEDSRDEGISFLLTNFSWADPNPRGGLCGGSISSSTGSFGVLKASTIYSSRSASSCGWLMATLRFCRFRWRVPINPTTDPSRRYKHYKVTWDVVFFPSGGGSPVVESADQTWEGNLDSEDLEDAGFYSPYYDLIPREEAGELRVVNVRFSCYHGTIFGMRPQVTGEAYP